MRPAIQAKCDEGHEFYFEAGKEKACPFCLQKNISDLDDALMSYANKSKKNYEAVNTELTQLLKPNLTEPSKKGFFAFANRQSNVIEIHRFVDGKVSRYGNEIFSMKELVLAEMRIKNLDSNHSVR